MTNEIKSTNQDPFLGIDQGLLEKFTPEERQNLGTALSHSTISEQERALLLDDYEASTYFVKLDQANLLFVPEMHSWWDSAENIIAISNEFDFDQDRLAEFQHLPENNYENYQQLLSQAQATSSQRQQPSEQLDEISGKINTYTEMFQNKATVALLDVDKRGKIYVVFLLKMKRTSQII